MYFLVGILLLLVLFLSLFHHHRKKKICKRTCSMSCDEKLEQITSLIDPLVTPTFPVRIFSLLPLMPRSEPLAIQHSMIIMRHGLAWSLTACPFILTTADAPGL